MRLTERLKFLLAKGQPGGSFWDIGCDHGYLAEAALRSGLYSQVHFLDPVAGQLSGTRQRVLSRDPGAEAENRAVFHLMKGEDLQIPVTGTAVIAGMGGKTMRQILSAWLERGHLRADRVILSPHKNEREIGEWLSGLAEYDLRPPESVLERGRVRVVLLIVPKTSRAGTRLP